MVVVGASVAGVRACRGLRSEGFGGRIILVGDEPELPYDKPPLSKQYLAGSFDRQALRLLTREQAARHQVDLRLGAAAAELDVASRKVLLADGSTLSYDACVVATGASARPAPWGKAPSGVYVLRTLTDSESLRQALTEGTSVAVVGGGFIGAEVASTAAARGCRVTVVDPLPVPIGAIAGDEVGGLLTAAHARHGVVTRFGVGVTRIAGEAGGLEIGLTDGILVRADIAVVGIGAVLNDAWLASSGLTVDDGVLCDQHCRAVGAPEVLAAGDVARWWHPRVGETVRVEHWTNAVEQAACVAHNIAHPDAQRAYAPVEYIWSDQYDTKIQIVGRPERSSRCRIVGEVVPPGHFAALYADDEGRLCGAVVVNWPRALVESRRALAGAGDLEALTTAVAALGGARPSGVSPPDPESLRRRGSSTQADARGSSGRRRC